MPTKNLLVSEKQNNSKPSADGFDALQHEFYHLQAQYTALFKLNELSLDCQDISDFYPKVHATLNTFINAKNFYMVMYDQTIDVIDFVYYADEKNKHRSETIPIDTIECSLTALVINSKQPLLASSEVQAALIADNKLIVYGEQALDWLGVPFIKDGFVVGMMAVKSYDEMNRYNDDDLNLLIFSAQHIMNVMERLQDSQFLYDAVNARTRDLMKKIRERERSELLQESFLKISELTNDNTLAITTFYKNVHNIVGQMINAHNFYIAKYDKDNQLLNFVYHDELLENNSGIEADFTTRKLSNLYTELVIRRAETVLLSHEEMETLYQKGEVSALPDNVVSWLGVPLVYIGEIIGVMVVQSYQEENVYCDEDVELMSFVSQHVSTALKRREMSDYFRESHQILEQQVAIRTVALEDEIKYRKIVEDRLRHTATHDSLTGLANRFLFIDLLNHAIASCRRKTSLKFAILFLDLDRFKIVNDSLGHHAGDLLLVEIARELKKMVREKDTVARLGGDEFVILIEDLEDDHEAFYVADRITSFIAEPFHIEEHPIFIGASVGVLFSNERYLNADIMLRDADTAMYHAKDTGKGHYEVFDTDMHNKVQNILSLEADIREAISWHEFIPYFQPIFNLSSNTLIGFEALARWQSPKRGFVYPNDFIPLAEDTDLVMEIDLQIIEQACQQLKEWEDSLDCGELYVSCNLYCKQFFSSELPNKILAILDKTGLSANRLRLEVTERALMENSDVVLENMRALRSLGIIILLDDFGTGYSSLSYLHKFPLDVIKIDQSFISNVHAHPNNRSIIKTIIDLADNLNMSTVAEGIELLSDAHLLQELGCEYGQGYYFAKPMSTAYTENYIKEHLF